MTFSKITIVSAIIASLMANPIMNIGGNQQTINNVGATAGFWGNPGFRGRLFDRRDSVNNDGVFNNIFSNDQNLRILNRPKVDKHVDATAANSNTAGDSTNTLTRRDSVNNNGVFNNIVSNDEILKVLNRPKVDKHVDADAHNDNTAGSAVNSGTIARRSAPDGITQNWFSQANELKVLNTPTVAKPVGATAAGSNEAGGIVNNRMRKRDSVNNNGILNNVVSETSNLRILNRPKVDKHVDADAHNDNTAGDAVNSGQIARRQFQLIEPGAQAQGGFSNVQFIGGGPAVWGFGAPSVSSNNILIN